MVAKSAPLPNVRKLFIPDPGYMIAEADLSGADAQVVAWEAGDEDLKTAFRSGMKIHIKNARDIFPKDTAGLSDADLKKLDHPGGIYHDCKTAVHATNYGAKPPTIANSNRWPLVAAQRFQDNWFSLHPGIWDWQDRVEHNLQTTRTVRNRFGYRIVYFDRLDRLLPEALAWIPQSTVANVCVRGAIKLRRTIPWCQILLQVHDSLIFQYPLRYHARREEIGEVLNSICVPYDDPLYIPWSFACSKKSWGDCVQTPWTDQKVAA